MNKRLIKAISLVVLLPVICISGYTAWSSWNNYQKFMRFFEDATYVINDIANISDEMDDSDRKPYVDEWNKKANAKVKSFYARYADSENKEIKDSIIFTRTLFQEVFGLRLNYADAIEPLYSERMLDHQTVGDQDEYEWRMQTVDGIYQFIHNYEGDLNKAIDAFRESIVTSSWTDRYRVFAWQEWGQNIKPQLAKILPSSDDAESLLMKHQRFFAYMYKEKEAYYINEKGEFIFSNQRYLTDGLRVMNSMGSQWQKYGVNNPLN